MKSQKQFFLMSFLPAIAYWYLEANYSLQTALVGGGILALLEITLEKIFTKKVHSISKFNFYLIVVLGSIAFIGEEGIWFKLQPFFTGIFMGGYLFYRAITHNGLMLETMKTMGNKVPDDQIILTLERDMSIFLIIYGCFMAFVAFKMTTGQWTFFKTIGFYIATFLFFGIELLCMKKRAKGRAR